MRIILWIFQEKLCNFNFKRKLTVKQICNHSEQVGHASCKLLGKLSIKLPTLCQKIANLSSVTVILMFIIGSLKILFVIRKPFLFTKAAGLHWSTTEGVSRASGNSQVSCGKNPQLWMKLVETNAKCAYISPFSSMKTMTRSHKCYLSPLLSLIVDLRVCQLYNVWFFMVKVTTQLKSVSAVLTTINCSLWLELCIQSCTSKLTKFKAKVDKKIKTLHVYGWCNTL